MFLFVLCSYLYSVITKSEAYVLINSVLRQNTEYRGTPMKNVISIGPFLGKLERFRNVWGVTCSQEKLQQVARTGWLLSFLVADTQLYTLPCRSVRPSEIFLKLRAVFALLLLHNRPRLDCRLSALVSFHWTSSFPSFPSIFLSCVLEVSRSIA